MHYPTPGGFGTVPLPSSRCVCWPRLYWSRSRVFDHLYADGERLLEGFPVQATIALRDSDSEESDSEDSEDEREDVEE
ncbi:unnamed protein product [Lampetra fluviatilis]